MVLSSLDRLPTTRTRRFLIIGALGIAAALMAIAVIVYVGNPRSTDLPVAIQTVSPLPGSNVLSQSAVMVDLAVGYDAELDINGVPIPREQLFEARALNQIRFQPGVDQVLDRLFPDQNCARVSYWLIEQGPASSQTYTWCFFAS